MNNETVGHYASHPTTLQLEDPRIKIYEQALRQILKARQIAHAKSIAKEAYARFANSVSKTG